MERGWVRRGWPPGESNGWGAGDSSSTQMLFSLPLSLRFKVRAGSEKCWLLVSVQNYGRPDIYTEESTKESASQKRTFKLFCGYHMDIIGQCSKNNYDIIIIII